MTRPPLKLGLFDSYFAGLPHSYFAPFFRANVFCARFAALSRVTSSRSL
jgi:hypothetical protein